MAARTVRFAPSPNGYLHVGHAYSAVLNHEFARNQDGRFLLRIEDIDSTRARPEFEQAIVEDIGWLGLTWEQPVRRQSDHLEDYQQALEQLRQKGLLYPCFCSRQDIRHACIPGLAGKDPDGAPLYPGTCRRLKEDERQRRRSSGEPFALRLDMERAQELAGEVLYWTELGDGKERRVEAHFAAWGDVVLARKDIGTSYHIAVVVDDWLQGVTDIIRGEDLFEATAIHRLLQHLLGYRAPKYWHHRLLKDVGGNKLSKRAGSASLRDMRNAGIQPDQILQQIMAMPVPVQQ